MGRASSRKYEVGNIKKSVLKTFSDPEVKKGVGSALIFLGVVSGVMGITFTAVAYGSPRESAHTFPAAGPCLLVVTMVFFVTGALLVRHRNFGCFKTRNGESETNTKNGSFLMFCCFCEKEMPLYKERKVDELTITRHAENALACDNCSISKYNGSNNNVIDISGSLRSFSSLRNSKVYPADV